MENRVLAHRFARTFNREELLYKMSHYGTVCTLTEITANFCFVTGQLVTDGNDDHVEGC
jgi:hypothetical protein